jgi:hypothetical protein
MVRVFRTDINLKIFREKQTMALSRLRYNYTQTFAIKLAPLKGWFLVS